MTIKLKKTVEGCEVFLEGKLDSLTSYEAETIFNRIKDEYSYIVLDLTDLQYVSSAGLRVLKILHINMAEKNGQLYFRHPGKNVMEVFELTGFAGLFRFID